jgi:hypothetical protein
MAIVIKGRRGPVRLRTNAQVLAYLGKAPSRTLAVLESRLGVIGYFWVNPTGSRRQLVIRVDLDAVDPDDPAFDVGTDIVALGSANAPTWEDGGLKLDGSGQVILPGLGQWANDPFAEVTAIVKIRQTGAVDGAYAMAGLTMSGRTKSFAGGISRAAGLWYRLKGDKDPAGPFTVSGTTSPDEQVATPAAAFEYWSLLASCQKVDGAATQKASQRFGGWLQGGTPGPTGSAWGDAHNVLQAGWNATDRELLLAASHGGAGTLEMVVTRLIIHQGGLI